MQIIQINTPLNVNVNIQAAGVGRRFLAFIIDYLIIILFLVSLDKIFSGVYINPFSNDENSAFVNIILTLIFFPVIFYSLWTEYLFNGQSFGKMICKIRVVKINGYKAGFSEYFMRWIFQLVDFWTSIFLILIFSALFGERVGASLGIIFFPLSGIVAFISIIKTKKSQRIGDIVAGTTVVKLKEKESISITILEDIKEDYKPKYSEVLRLSDNDARIIKNTFQSASKTKDKETLAKLRKKLEDVMGVKAEEKDEEFIDRVLKDFNYYTQQM